MSEAGAHAVSRAEQALAAVAGSARRAGVEAYAVGGYVRDHLIGAATADIDLLVTGRLEAIAETVADDLGATVVRLSDEHGAIRLVFADRSHLDLAAPRGEGGAGGGRSAVDAVTADLRLRDFTINAIAVPLAAVDRADWRSVALDPTGGLRDLERRRLRATGPGVWRDDPLRLMRAVRLAAQLGFALEARTTAALRRHAALLSSVAPERVRDELFAVLAHPEAAAWIERAADLGLLFQVLPELAPLEGLAQGGYHHLDAWHHSLAAVAELQELAVAAPGLSDEHRKRLSEMWAQPLGARRGAAAGRRPRIALLKFAGLLHDVGKPRSRAPGADGHLHFYTHDTVGATIARGIGRRLRLSRREQQGLEIIVGDHMQPAFLAREQEVPRRAAHRFFRRTRDCAPDVLLVAWADRRAARGPLVTAEDLARLETSVRWLLAEWLDRGPLSHPQPPVGARAIMRRYQLAPGPLVGVLTERLIRRHAEQPCMDAEAAFTYLDRVVRRLRPKEHDTDR